MSPNRLTRTEFKSLESRTASGDSGAAEELAAHYRDGACDGRGRVIVRSDQRRALTHFRRAAEAGRPEAMSALATMLDDAGQTQEALRWYRRAARRGDLSAAFNLGVVHRREGRLRLAVRWFERAREQGDPSAALELALAELYGTGRPRNAARALKTLANLYDSSARTLSQYEREQICIVIARVHLEGWLAPIDWETARTWLERASKLGSEEAAGLLRDLG